MTVSGVVRNIETEHTGVPDGPAVYRPWVAGSGSSTLVVRFAGEAPDVAVRVRDVVRRFDPDARTFPRTLRMILDERAEAGTPLIRMISVLGLLALSLSALGIYGVVAFRVSRRTKEIGIRMALGAAKSSIVQSVFAAGLRPIVMGLVARAALAFVAGKALETFMRKTPVSIVAGDPAAFSVVVAVLSAVAVLAMLKPTLRAARLDPSRALRDE